MIPRPTFRLPIWAALAIVSAAYLFRSAVIRRGNFSVDLSDTVAIFVVIVAVVAVALARRQNPPDQSDPDAQQQGDGEDRRGGDRG